MHIRMQNNFIFKKTVGSH